jgi:hypothetical protein
MKLKLTAESVAAAAATGKQYYITDTELSRFALRVSATGKSKGTSEKRAVFDVMW